MKTGIGGFDWDGGNLKKCRKHGVSVAEIEALFLGEVLIQPDIAHSLKEERLKAIGRIGKRYLFVVFTMRKKGGAQLIRPVSARYMHRKEIARYEEKIEKNASFKNR